jgi:lysozyme
VNTPDPHSEREHGQRSLGRLERAGRRDHRGQAGGGVLRPAYDDNGALPGGTWTIGYGTIRDAAGKAVTPSTSAVTEAQAVKLLLRDMKRAALDVHNRVRAPLLVHEAAALVSWTYNLGEGALRASTLLRKLNAGEKTAVPDEMRRWINQNGKPLVGLLRRRWAEAAIFLGKDPVNACVRAWREIDDLDDWPGF